MTIYERKMEIYFDTDMDDVPNHAQKVQGMLYNRGIAQTSSYNYTNPESQPSKYGFQEKEDTTTTYSITDSHGQVVMELDYHSQAQLALEGLKNYGINGTIGSIETTKRMDTWMRVQGPHLGIFDGDINGEQDWYGKAKIEYDDNVFLTAKLETYGYTYSLIFTIIYEVDKISNRKAVEEKVVQVPLAEMMRIREAVEAVLSELSACELTHTVDCETKIISEATYQCSPETTALVMGDEE